MTNLNGTKKLSKKETRKTIFQKLSTALAEYKSKPNDKKFDRSLKKFSKTFSADVVRATHKKNGGTGKKVNKVQVKQVNELQPTQ
jgi:hypothetical protein